MKPLKQKISSLLSLLLVLTFGLTASALDYPPPSPFIRNGLDRATTAEEARQSLGLVNTNGDINVASLADDATNASGQKVLFDSASNSNMVINATGGGIIYFTNSPRAVGASIDTKGVLQSSGGLGGNAQRVTQLPVAQAGQQSFYQAHALNQQWLAGDYQEADLGNTNIFHIHGFIFLRSPLGTNYLFASTRSTPASIIRINPDDVSSFSVITTTNDGNHNSCDDIVFANGKVYGAFGVNQSSSLILFNVDPDTLAYSETTIPSFENTTGSPVITSDGTNLFVFTESTVGSFAKISFGGALLSTNFLASENGTTFTNNFGSTPHSCRFDGRDIYVSGFVANNILSPMPTNPALKTSPWIAKVNPADLSFTGLCWITNSTIGTNNQPANMTDDFADSGDYLWFGFETYHPELILRVRKSDMTYDWINVAETNAWSNFGNYYDGRYVWACYASSPAGTLWRIDPVSLEATEFLLTTNQASVNEIISDGLRYWVTGWGNVPATVTRFAVPPGRDIVKLVQPSDGIAASRMALSSSGTMSLAGTLWRGIGSNAVALYVDPSGTAQTARRGDPLSPFPNVDMASAAATNAGDVIILGPGSYYATNALRVSIIGQGSSITRLISYNYDQSIYTNTAYGPAIFLTNGMFVGGMQIDSAWSDSLDKASAIFSVTWTNSYGFASNVILSDIVITNSQIVLAVSGGGSPAFSISARNCRWTSTYENVSSTLIASYLSLKDCDLRAIGPAVTPPNSGTYSANIFGALLSIDASDCSFYAQNTNSANLLTSASVANPNTRLGLYNCTFTNSPNSGVLTNVQFTGTPAGKGYVVIDGCRLDVDGFVTVNKTAKTVINSMDTVGLRCAQPSITLSNQVNGIFPTAAQLGVGGVSQVIPSNGIPVVFYSLDGSTLVMKALAP